MYLCRSDRTWMASLSGSDRQQRLTVSRYETSESVNQFELSYFYIFWTVMQNVFYYENLVKKDVVCKYSMCIDIVWNFKWTCIGLCSVLSACCAFGHVSTIGTQAMKCGGCFAFLSRPFSGAQNRCDVMRCAASVLVSLQQSADRQWNSLYLCSWSSF